MRKLFILGIVALMVLSIAVGVVPGVRADAFIGLRVS